MFNTRYKAPSGYRQVKKDVHYTVTPITDLPSWKAGRELEDLRLAQERQKRVTNVSGALQAALEGGAQMDVESVKRIEAALKDEKRAFIRTKSMKNYWVDPHQEPMFHETPPTPSLFAQAKSALRKLWDSAFPG